MNEIFMYIILFIAGIVAGFINTLAGGGSILVLPILILSGLPSMEANATNRIAILFQNMTGSRNFYKSGKLRIKPYLHIILAVILGAGPGTFFSLNLRTEDFDKILGIVLIFVVILMFRTKKRSNRFTSSLPKWLEFIIFLAVGFYGGFIQVGIGFVLLATLSLVEHFDLVRANALKVFLVMCYTVIAVSVFVFSRSHLIVWKYGFILAFGNIIGAYIGVKAALTKGEQFIKYILLIAVIIASFKLFGIMKFISTVMGK